MEGKCLGTPLPQRERRRRAEQLPRGRSRRPRRVPKNSEVAGFLLARLADE